MRRREPTGHRTESESELEVDAIAERFLDQLQAGHARDRGVLLEAYPEIADLLDRHLALVEMLHWARLHVSRPDL